MPKSKDERLERKITVRQERAAATRRRMLSAANTVFSDDGYSHATMDAIAVSAGVAVQTLYFTFHTKAELLQATYEFVVLGPDPVPPHLTSWWVQAEAEEDLDRAITLLVDGTIEVFERAAPLVWAVHSDPDARGAYQFNERLRLEGYQLLIELLRAKAPLRPELSIDQARDVLFTLLGPQMFMMLTHEQHWTVGSYRAWVTVAIRRELFA